MPPPMHMETTTFLAPRRQERRGLHVHRRRHGRSGPVRGGL